MYITLLKRIGIKNTIEKFYSRRELICLKISSFEVLKKEFDDIILRVEDKDKTGSSSTMFALRKTIVLNNRQKLYVTERINRNNEILEAWYDLHDADGSELMKFHKHDHDDGKLRTETCPFHIQFPSNKLNTTERLSNYNFRDLFHVMEFIRLMIVYIKEY